MVVVVGGGDRVGFGYLDGVWGLGWIVCWSMVLFVGVVCA